MLMSEFLTAVHHKLPVKVIVYNNSAFGLIPLEAEAAGYPHTGTQSNSPIRTSVRLPERAAVMDLGLRSLASCMPRSTRHSKPKGRQLSIASFRPTRCPTCRISNSKS